MTTPSQSKTHYYLFDTRLLWNPIPPSPTSRTPVSFLAPAIASLLPRAEREKSSAFYFLKDAKLSLASSLLKRFFVVRALHGKVKWNDVELSRKGDDKFGKPCVLFSPPDTADEQCVDFNVSHQAGLVVLAGFVCERVVAVGVDVTCTAERRERDVQTIAEEGFESWVRVHESVFSEADLHTIVHGEGEQEEKLRRFYAFWALKEAYVKMEGEALLATWLRDVEFRLVRVPGAQGKEGDGRWGGCAGGIQVWIGGVRRENVELWLQAFEDDYLIATSVLAGDEVAVEAPVWEEVNLERDILPAATKGT